MRIIYNMELKKNNQIEISVQHSDIEKEGIIMQEKYYKLMKRSGGGNIALGVVVLACGVICGVLMIVNGAMLLKRKSEMIF